VQPVTLLQDPIGESRDLERFVALALDLDSQYPEGFEVEQLEAVALKFGFARDYITGAITRLLDENKFFMPRPDAMKKV